MLRVLWVWQAVAAGRLAPHRAAVMVIPARYYTKAVSTAPL